MQIDPGEAGPVGLPNMRGTCPVCEKSTKCRISTGDGILIPCEDCGPYNISGRALELLENETLARPDPKEFKALVEKKRGARKIILGSPRMT